MIPYEVGGFPPKLSHVKEKDGVFYMYFWRLYQSTISEMTTGRYTDINMDPRLVWVDWTDPQTWPWYCWKTDKESVVVEYVLKYG